MSDYAQLDTIRFDAGPMVSTSRVGWALQSITDWLSVTRPKNDPDPRQTAHGAFAPGDLWREGSVHTLTVAYYGTSTLDLEDAIRALDGLAEHHGTIPLTVTAQGRPTRRDVWIESITTPDHRLRSRLTGIEIDVKSDSPFAYGEPSVVSCGRPTSGDGIASPLASPLQVTDMAGLHSSWTGDADRSPSTLARDGNVIATNHYADPNALINQGAWSSDGYLAAIRAEDGIHWTLDAPSTYHVFCLFTLMNGGGNTGMVGFARWNETGAKASIENSTELDSGPGWCASLLGEGNHALFGQLGFGLTPLKYGLYSQSDWQAMQEAGVTWFDGGSVPYPQGTNGDPGRVSFVNAGTTSTPLLLTVSGGGMTQGVRLRRVETGETVQLDFPVLDGQAVVFDSSANRATLDNQSDMTGYLTVDDWFDAPPGEITTVQFEPLGDITGDPTLTLEASPAWY